MPRRLCLSVLLALLALAAAPGLASAGWFPATPVDGPSPDITKLGGVDLARDGTGGLVYLKQVDGAPHVFLSRFNGGQFRPPERVDNGLAAGGREAAIAAADRNPVAGPGTAGKPAPRREGGGGATHPRPLSAPAAASLAPPGP